MAAQSEVIDAFIEGEEYPRIASNMRKVDLGDGRQYLCGGDDGREIVIASKAPIDQYVVWRNVPLGLSMRYGAGRAQCRRTRRQLGRNCDYVETRRNDAPRVEHIDEITDECL